MNPPEEAKHPRTTIFSPEAIIGLGITIASVGVMCLLLGFAQSLREVEKATWILVPLGAVLLVIGVLATLMARTGARKK